MTTDTKGWPVNVSKAVAAFAGYDTATRKIFISFITPMGHPNVSFWLTADMVDGVITDLHDATAEWEEDTDEYE